MSDELGRIVNLADDSDDDVKDRLRKRLIQDRGPSTKTQSGTWVNWGNMEGILGQPFDVSKIPLSKLEQMRRDPILAFGLMFIKVPLVRAHWKIKSVDPQRAEFVDRALRRIYGRLVLAYCNCFDFGFSPIVKRFEYDTPDWTYIDPETHEEKEVWPDKNIKAIVWKPFVPLNPRHAAPHYNSRGEFAGIDFTPQGGISPFFNSGAAAEYFRGVHSTTNAGRAADIPLDWALWATNEKDSEYNSLYGYPRIGYAYRYWWSYWYKFGLSDRAFEKWGDPPVVVWHPADTAAEDSDGNSIDFGEEALAVAEQLRSGANVAMPTMVVRGYDDRQTNVREWDFKQLESEANFDALNNSFEYLDVQKLRSLMVPEQALVEGKGGSSSRNVASEFGDLFQASMAVVMAEIDDLINRFMIPQLLEVNFGTGGPACEKVTTGFDPQDIDTMRALVDGLANKQGQIAEVDYETLLQRLGIPVLTHAAIERRMREIAEHEDLEHDREIAKMRESAVLKGHKIPPPGEASLSEDFSEEEKSGVRKFFDKILGRDNEIEDEEEVDTT